MGRMVPKKNQPRAADTTDQPSGRVSGKAPPGSMNRHFFPRLTGCRDHFAGGEGCFTFDPFIVLHHTWSWEKRLSPFC